MKSILPSLVLLGSASLAPAAITLLDSTFDFNNIGANTNLQNGASANWPGGGAAQLLDNTSGSQWYNGNATGGGVQSVSLASSYITQQLNDGATPVMTSSTVGQQFDISFYAASRKGASAPLTGIFGVGLQAYNGNTFESTLTYQRYQLGTDADATTIDLGLSMGQWTANAINLSLTTPLDASPSNIRLVFAQLNQFGSGIGSNEAGIDNVSIALVPEPSAALLGGLGILALLRRRRA